MKIETIKEFHENGQLAYSDEVVYFSNINDLTDEQRKMAVVKPDGSGLYRVGITQKIFDNGQLAWKIDRKAGTVEHYRRDGSRIVY